MREPVKQSFFYLGEVIVCEAEVEIDGTRGFAVLMGDNAQKALQSVLGITFPIRVGLLQSKGKKKGISGAITFPIRVELLQSAWSSAKKRAFNNLT